MILKNRLMICINLNFERYLTHIFNIYFYPFWTHIFNDEFDIFKTHFHKLNVSVLLRFMFEDLLDYFQIEIRHQKIILFQPFG